MSHLILGKKCDSPSDPLALYLIHRKGLRTKSHQWRNLKHLPEDIIERAQAFEKAFDFRNFMIQEINKDNQKMQPYTSFRIKNGEFKAIIKYPRAIEGVSQYDLMNILYKKKYKELRSKSLLSDEIIEEIKNDTTLEFSTNLEPKVKNITVKVVNKEISYEILKNDNTTTEEETFEKLLNLYPNQLCRALIEHFINN